jgi:hypothetical protein
MLPFLTAKRNPLWQKGHPYDARILDSMVKRLFSLVTAMVIGVAPVALEACQINCKSPSVQSVRTHGTHNDADQHYDHASHDSRQEMAAAPHLSQTHSCEHDRPVAEPSVASGRGSDLVPVPVAVRVPGTDDIAPARRATLVRGAQLTPSGGPEVRPFHPLRI